MSRFHDPVIGALLILCVIYLLAGEIYDLAKAGRVPELARRTHVTRDSQVPVMADEDRPIATDPLSLVAAQSPMPE